MKSVGPALCDGFGSRLIPGPVTFERLVNFLRLVSAFPEPCLHGCFERLRDDRPLLRREAPFEHPETRFVDTPTQFPLRMAQILGLQRLAPLDLAIQPHLPLDMVSGAVQRSVQ